ncbi:MAG: hypothetical protein ACK53Y_16025, partial [bacterium]
MITEGGLRVKQGKIENFSPNNMLIGLWKHECDRVFSDKLTNNKDKGVYQEIITQVGVKAFGEDLFYSACCKEKYMVSFLRDDVYD